MKGAEIRNSKKDSSAFQILDFKMHLIQFSEQKKVT